jgi:hypothetical protein
MLASLIVALALAAWPSAESQPLGDSIGVLIGLRNSIDPFSQDKNPPEIDRLRTLWVPSPSAGNRVTPVELPDLLVPRRSGFWRVGVSGWCVEQDYFDVDEKPSGSMTELFGSIVAAPQGTNPPDFKRGSCKRSDVHCVTESVATIMWVWPEYISVMDGGESSCGAHSGGSWVRSVKGLSDLQPVSVRTALGPSAETLFRQAFEKARTEDRDFRAQSPIGDKREWADTCGDQAVTFDPRSWLIEREDGRWRLQGWTETHRLCGVGFDYAVDTDVSRIAGRRGDDASRWRALMTRWPELDDVHTSPDRRWTVIAAGEAVMIFAGASLDREILRVPKARFEQLVMVEWATGSNVRRWNDEVIRFSRMK